MVAHHSALPLVDLVSLTQDVSENALSGPLPQTWNFTGFIPGLISINLANNKFTG
jgi:hypothetical protein